MKIEIRRDNGEIKAEIEGDGEAVLAYTGEYAKGDEIFIDGLHKNTFYRLKIDDSIDESLVYVTETSFVWPIPFYEKKADRNPLSFLGARHYISIRYAREDEVHTYKNLALNSADSHDITGVYPHATANVETRGESVFAAQNAIDGYKASFCHGEWPYQSWGINRREDAALTIDFGRDVDIKQIRLYLRADIPHDSWWESVTMEFSDGTKEIVDTAKPDGAPQIYEIEKNKIRWIRLENLKKHQDESPFPALTQIEVYGDETKIN